MVFGARNLGDYAVECGEPYFYYGKNLLELARMEPGVFTHALDGSKYKHMITNNCCYQTTQVGGRRSALRTHSAIAALAHGIAWVVW